MGRFEDALRHPGLTAIAEVKRRSPSAGDLRPDADPGALAAAYEQAGAAAVSILVDERFGGTWDDLRAARASATLPLLAKGFFSTEEHLRTARDAGADAALAPASRPRRRGGAPPARCRRGARPRDARRSPRRGGAGACGRARRAGDRASTRAISRRFASTARSSSGSSRAPRAIVSSSPRAGSSRGRRVRPPSSRAPMRSSSARRSCARPTPPRSWRSSSRGRSSRSAD